MTRVKDYAKVLPRSVSFHISCYHLHALPEHRALRRKATDEAHKIILIALSPHDKSMKLFLIVCSIH